MPRAFVSIGSNIDRENNVRLAVHELHRHFGAVTPSRVVETVAVGFDGDPFYNLVVVFETEQDPEDVRKVLRGIESKAGRKREGVPSFGPRTLDLDLILYGDLVRHDELIDVPAADIERYDFVLGPLAELAPDFQHPELGVTVGEMWQAAGTDVMRCVPLSFEGGT